MTSTPAALEEFAAELRKVTFVSDLMVAGSLATGDYVPYVSDLDLVALADGDVDTAAIVEIHRRLDAGAAKGLNLGCVYVGGTGDRHPTWTHGQLVDRALSLITRAELARHGYAIFGREPRDVFPEVAADDIRAAARAELTGYWAWAARRPWIWLDPAVAELGLTSMARGRHALAQGDLLTKTRAIERADAPAWLIDELRARRRGGTPPRSRLRTAWIAWRDARRTVAVARRGSPGIIGRWL
jgi:predicted nucleotidyltransferase